MHVAHQDAAPDRLKMMAFTLTGFPVVWLLAALIHAIDADVNGFGGLASANVLFSVTLVAAALFVPALLALLALHHRGIPGYVVALFLSAGMIGLLIALAGSTATTLLRWAISIGSMTLICAFVLTLASLPGLLYFLRRPPSRSI